MLFIAGPRQVGKTTYAKRKLKEFGGSYFNWDDSEIRRAYNRDASFFTKSSKNNQLVVFDEIHKRKKWKDVLKGIFDVHREEYKFLITGSAKLDVFRRSGDSLVGRYFLTHLLPLSVGDLSNLDFKEFTNAEVLIKKIKNSEITITNKDLEPLINLGGFPEPFFRASKSFQKRWQEQHQELLIREDLKDLSNIQQLETVENLVDLLNPRTARPLSYNSLAEDLEVNHITVKRWVLQLEKIMLTYRVKP